VASAAAPWTFFGGHTDADYARSVQGRDHVYLATGPILGLLDRYVTSGAGPEAFLANRSVRMVDSLAACVLATVCYQLPTDDMSG
jgi:hypothetical protein